MLLKDYSSTFINHIWLNFEVHTLQTMSHLQTKNAAYPETKIHFTVETNLVAEINLKKLTTFFA